MLSAFRKNKWIVSFGINFFLFLFVIILLKPLLNSGDDAFLMYSFSGSFGPPPTELVDYSWGWHFSLGFIIKHLFILIPSINWYTLFLLAIHYFSCSLIFIFFLRSFRPLYAILFYSIFFIFFEITLLLSLSFTNASIICAIAGNVLVIERLFRKDFKKSMLILPFFLLLVSGLLRFHTWAFTEIIFGLFILFLHRKKSVVYLVFKIGLLGLLILFFVIHQNYYKNKIPGWTQKEHRSQIMLDYFNSPTPENKFWPFFKDSTEVEFFYNLFYYDSLYFTDQRLKDIVHQLRRSRDFSNPNDWQRVYWTFVNSRLYLLILALSLLFLVLEKQWGLLKKASLFLLCSLLLYIYLFIFRKITEPIFMGFLILNWLVIFLLFIAAGHSYISQRTRLIFIPLLSFCFFGGFIRIYKINSGNIEKYNKWICYYDDLKKNPTVIHISTNPGFPVDYFSISDNPKNFVINNFLSIGQICNTDYYQKKEKMGLRNILEDMLTRYNISFIGPRLNSLKAYYFNKFNKRVILTDDTTHYRCANVYKIIVQN